MGSNSYSSWHEIMTQPLSWQGAMKAVEARMVDLAHWLEGIRERELLFIGCGSTYCLSLFAAPFFQQVTGWRSRGIPSSEVVWQTSGVIVPGTRPGVVALSRSGETTETLLAVQTMKHLGAQTLALTCYGEAELARLAHLAVVIPQGQEESFAQTRSFAGMLVAVQALASLASHDEVLWEALCCLVDYGEDVIARANPLAQRIGQDMTIQRITYLGSGPLYGLASEATIKMKEMSLSIAEAYHFMEFRHGPMALVDESHLIVALLSESMCDYEVGVLRDLKARGARILAIANEPHGLESTADDVFALGTSLPERALAVLYLPFVQLLAYHRAIAKGLNPDRPRNVFRAIKLSDTEMEQS